ncbi:MAG: hypothetical protein AMXMBFR33_03950 [Candidatus Xenobia bacterium]|jgi:hypothetical protein
MHHHRSRSAYLVWSLTLMVLLAPFFVETPHLSHHLIARILITIGLAAGVYAVSHDRGHLILCGILMLATVVLSLCMIWWPVRAMIIANLILGAVLYFVLALLLVQHIMRTRRVTADTIYTSVAGYQLLVAGWAALYLLVAVVEPGSFTGNLHPHPPLPFNFFEALYFSTTTLTSVGYGDIIPVSPMARALAVVEMWMGALYPAVLIARLVGMYSGPSETGSI